MRYIYADASLPPLQWLTNRRRPRLFGRSRYGWPQTAGGSRFGGYYPGVGGAGDVYGMHAMPPPVYDASAPRPPMYSGPPEGGSKVDAFQDASGARMAWPGSGAGPVGGAASGPQREYDAPPPGPPAAAGASRPGWR